MTKDELLAKVIEHYEKYRDATNSCECNCGAMDCEKKFKPKKVIYNYPATIVLWEDGTKTVVKRQFGDTYSAMKGLALCYMKKALDNSSRRFNDALRDAGF